MSRLLRITEEEAREYERKNPKVRFSRSGKALSDGQTKFRITQILTNEQRKKNGGSSRSRAGCSHISDPTIAAKACRACGKSWNPVTGKVVLREPDTLASVQ